MEPTATTDDGDHPLGPDAAAILAAEHWSLLATRTMLTSERLSRTAVFLTMLSAAIVALALVADATGFGPRTRTLALVLLPVVLLLGVATYARLVQIEGLEVKLVLAMNRLRHGYLRIAPGVAPYLSTGHHDDARGVATTLMVAGPRELHPLAHFLISTRPWSGRWTQPWRPPSRCCSARRRGRRPACSRWRARSRSWSCGARSSS
jgi:hypothetical protein